MTHDADATAATDIAALPPWMRGIFTVGVPSAIALFLVWWMTSTVTRQLDLIEAKVDLSEASRAHDMGIQGAFLFAICLNTAASETDRARCAIPMSAMNMVGAPLVGASKFTDPNRR
jgi:hypothetical protein